MFCVEYVFVCVVVGAKAGVGDSAVVEVVLGSRRRTRLRLICTDGTFNHHTDGGGRKRRVLLVRADVATSEEVQV
jgi:hypothetical protein